jgi:hypothetical protein
LVILICNLPFAPPALGFQQHLSATSRPLKTVLSDSIDTTTDGNTLTFVRLREAVRRMDIIQQNSNDCCLQLMHQRPTVRVGPSSILGAGNGVFATKNITSGKLHSFHFVLFLMACLFNR